jgi:hypothetical protein
MYPPTSGAYTDCICNEAEGPRFSKDAGYRKGIESIPDGLPEFEYDERKRARSKGADRYEREEHRCR